MSGFISRAACRGRRPSPFSALKARDRPSLLRLLLKDRGVARFIVAPNGYGKTTLAVLYAETIMSWAHTFWVNAQSPCFLRDLDLGTLSSGCFEFDPEAKLVVFDELPLLESDRMSLFSQAIDQLIARECEVIVTCAPMCDTAGPFQLDRIRLGARDLLLDDDELDGLRSPEERMRRKTESLGAAHRMPALAWPDEDGRGASFVKAVLYEEMPPDLLLLAASTLVLREGSLDDLLELGPFDRAFVEDMREDYPHLGFDADVDQFEAPAVSVEDLASPIKRLSAQLATWSSFPSVSSLVTAWANLLLRSRQAARACELIGALCPRNNRAAWLIPRASDLVRQGCILPTYRLAVDRESCKGAARMQLGAIEALCLRILGDREGALKCARRRAFDQEAPHDARTLSALIVARYASGQEAKHARDVLAAESQLVSAASSDGFPWPYLALGWCACTQGLHEMLFAWSELRKRDAGSLVLAVCASWAFSLLSIGKGDPPIAEPDAERLLACERYVRQQLVESLSSGSDYYLASAGLSLEEAHDRGFAYRDGPLPAAVLMALRQAEIGILAQRQGIDEDRRRALLRRGDWVASHPDMLMNQGSAPVVVRERSAVPLLTLRMFGKFDVSIGEEHISEKRFHRKNARILLVMLAVNQGREVSREAVASAMWPKSVDEVARKNFYAVWSHLRSALALPDGTCPYLVRHRYGCSLDARYVHSDIDRFNEICRELLFGVPNYERWSLLFMEIDRDFAYDFLPTEQKNGIVDRARVEYRARLVDALVAAALSIAATDTPQWGIWFARAAVNRDELREDAHVALMRAQVASNQRTAAMMTYLKCRRVLSEQLGIDPSPETTAIYERLLKSE